MKPQEIFTYCPKCLEENTISLETDYYICAACGERNSFDPHKFKDQLKVILRKVFGEKPEKPENN